MSQEYPKQVAPPEMGSRVTYKVVTVANPGAGLEWTATVPAGKMWEVLAINWTFTPDATVGNRYSKLRTSDGTTEMSIIRASNVLATGTAYDMMYGNSSSVSGSAAGLIMTQWKPIVLPTGGYIKSQTVSIQAGDAHTNIYLYVKEIDIA